MGRFVDAREMIARLRSITSQVIPIDFTQRNQEERELLLSGLRLAAGEAE